MQKEDDMEELLELQSMVEETEPNFASSFSVICHTVD
jgi:hypothetical protein